MVADTTHTNEYKADEFIIKICFWLQSAEMMNFFLNTNNLKYENNDEKIMQTKIPQNAVNDKETFNDKTRKSLLKINLFIKRLKFFNIFATNQQQQQTNKAQKTMALATEHEKW